MREIEFRGKTSNGEWLYGGYIQAEAVICTKTSSIKFYVDPETIGQYTGIKDKNNEKIFEGDIVFANLGKDFIGKIIFKNCSYMVSINKSMSFGLGCSFSFIKVVGNIHDNPELLKEMKDY